MFLFLQIATNNKCGLCNQLYALTGAIDHGIHFKSYNIIIVDYFLKEINTNDYCNLSEIIDIRTFNSYLIKYNMLILDRSNIHFEITSIQYNNINIVLPNHFINNNLLHIPKHHSLLQLNDTTEENQILISYSLNGNSIKQLVPIIKKENHIYPKDDIILNFNYTHFRPSPQLYFGGSNNPQLFVDILTNIPFNKKFHDSCELSYNLIYKNPKQNINVIHLRIEDDALLSFSSQNNITKEIFKSNLENKYIEIIDKYIDKSDLNIIISNDFNNEVIHHLKKNKYLFTCTSHKAFRHRELNAIHDLLLSKIACTKYFIGVYESSYSYTVMYNIFQKIDSNVTSIILSFNNLTRPVSLFTKNSNIKNIQTGFNSLHN